MELTPRSPAFIGAFKLHKRPPPSGFLQVAVSEVPTTHHPGAISVPPGTSDTAQRLIVQVKRTAFDRHRGGSRRPTSATPPFERVHVTASRSQSAQNAKCHGRTK